MIGAVRGIDPQTGHYYDDTKRYIEATQNLTADESTPSTKAMPAACSRAWTRRSGQGSVTSQKRAAGAV
jgi:hypothetical protein